MSIERKIEYPDGTTKTEPVFPGEEFLLHKQDGSLEVLVIQSPDLIHHHKPVGPEEAKLEVQFVNDYPEEINTMDLVSYEGDRTISYSWKPDDA